MSCDPLLDDRVERLEKALETLGIVLPEFQRPPKPVAPHNITIPLKPPASELKDSIYVLSGFGSLGSLASIMIGLVINFKVLFFCGVGGLFLFTFLLALTSPDARGKWSGDL